MLRVSRYLLVRFLVMAVLGAALLGALVAVGASELKRLEQDLHQATAPTSTSHHLHPAAGAAHPRHTTLSWGGTARHAPGATSTAKPSAITKFLTVLEKAGLLLAFILGVFLLVLVLALARRLYARHRRVYHAYRINLTANDQTELQSMVQAVGAMGQAVAALPASRWWRGQPAFGLLVGYDPREGGEVTLALICEAEQIPTLDGALLKAYPNVRVGFDFEPVYNPMELEMGVPPALIRLRKRREAFHPIVDVAEELEGIETVIEGLADLMAAQRTHPAAVWFCIVPSDTGAGYLRARHRQTERWRRERERTRDGAPAPEASVDREEARQSAQIDERSAFYVDIQIAAHNLRTCKALSGTLQNLPGAMNTLERRPMLLRRRVYRGRFPRFTPPLIMRGQSKLFSGSELAYLMQLPSARLQAPIHRIPEPRLPAAPRTVSAAKDDGAWDYDPANLPVAFEALDDETLHTMLGTSRRRDGSQAGEQFPESSAA
ncbi:MAG: hypothetical protein FWD04_12525 [Conexibacteraceae bacterium]|nr:hypothetical protein [Conexibacteraceae bacterium]